MKVYVVVNMYTDIDGDLFEGRVADVCDTKEAALKYEKVHWRGNYKIKEFEVLNLENLSE